MQRIEINPNLKKPYRMIAYGLKELKETAHNVALSSNKFCALLTSINSDNLSNENKTLIETAKEHFQAIANSNDPWPIITTESLSDEEKICHIFRTIHLKFNDLEQKTEFEERLKHYAWVTLNLSALESLLNNLSLPDINRNDIDTTLYAPMQRLTKLKSFLDGFKNAFKNEEGENTSLLDNSMIGHIDSLHNEISTIAQVINRYIPVTDAANANIKPIPTLPAELMLQNLALFSSKFSAPIYELDLNDLESTINAMRSNLELKNHLTYLLFLVRADVAKQKIAHATPEQIEESGALKLCRYTQEMLNVVLRTRWGDLTANEVFARQLNAIQAYEANCDQTPGLTTFLEVALAALIAAVVTVLVVAAITGLSIIFGTLFGGPAGSVAGAVSGLIQGTYTGIGIGVGAASAVTGTSVAGIISRNWIFERDAATQEAFTVAKTVREILAP